MNRTTLAGYVTRDGIVRLLSADEVAAVSEAEDGVRLAEGDEYVDLLDLPKGVQQAGGAGPVMGHVLPRSAVQGDTWQQILDQIAPTNAG